MVVTELLPQPVASLETPPEAAQFSESQVGSSRVSCSYLSEFFIQVGSSSDVPQPSLPLPAPSGGRRVLTLEEAAVSTEEDAAVTFHCYQRDQLSARFAQLQEAQPAVLDAAFVAQMADLYLESQLAQLSLLTQLGGAKRERLVLLRQEAAAEAELALLRAGAKVVRLKKKATVYALAEMKMLEAAALAESGPKMEELKVKSAAAMEEFKAEMVGCHGSLIAAAMAEVEKDLDELVERQGV